MQLTREGIGKMSRTTENAERNSYNFKKRVVTPTLYVIRWKW